MDSAQGIETQPGHLAMRVAILNFASIHTTLLVNSLVRPELSVDFYPCAVQSRLLHRVRKSIA
jgi:hypothetical protein